ncbi:hypothetical protein BH20ACT2_BH20ACT2_07760 [soil metagenome]
MAVVRLLAGTVLRCVGWLVLVLGALPTSLVLANATTATLTGWSRPDPEGIVQGCETNITCAESTTFWPVLGVIFVVYAVGGVVLARTLGRRSS